MNKPKVLSHEEWAELNPGLVGEEICNNCDGEGITMCGECYSELECNTCNGIGQIEGNYVLYKDQVKYDLAKWNTYHNA